MFPSPAAACSGNMDDSHQASHALSLPPQDTSTGQNETLEPGIFTGMSVAQPIDVIFQNETIEEVVTTVDSVELSGCTISMAEYSSPVAALAQSCDEDVQCRTVTCPDGVEEEIFIAGNECGSGDIGTDNFGDKEGSSEQDASLNVDNYSKQMLKDQEYPHGVEDPEKAEFHALAVETESKSAMLPESVKELNKNEQLSDHEIFHNYVKVEVKEVPPLAPILLQPKKPGAPKRFVVVENLADIGFMHSAKKKMNSIKKSKPKSKTTTRVQKEDLTQITKKVTPGKKNNNPKPKLEKDYESKRKTTRAVRKRAGKLSVDVQAEENNVGSVSSDSSKRKNTTNVSSDNRCKQKSSKGRKVSKVADDKIRRTLPGKTDDRRPKRHCPKIDSCYAYTPIKKVKIENTVPITKGKTNCETETKSVLRSKRKCVAVTEITTEVQSHTHSKLSPRTNKRQDTNSRTNSSRIKGHVGEKVSKRKSTLQVADNTGKVKLFSGKNSKNKSKKSVGKLIPDETTDVSTSGDSFSSSKKLSLSKDNEIIVKKSQTNNKFVITLQSITCENLADIKDLYFEIEVENGIDVSEIKREEQKSNFTKYSFKMSKEEDSLMKTNMCNSMKMKKSDGDLQWSDDNVNNTFTDDFSDEEHYAEHENDSCADDFSFEENGEQADDSSAHGPLVNDMRFQGTFDSELGKMESDQQKPATTDDTNSTDGNSVLRIHLSNLFSGEDIKMNLVPLNDNMDLLQKPIPPSSPEITVKDDTGVDEYSSEDNISNVDEGTFTMLHEAADEENDEENTIEDFDNGNVEEKKPEPEDNFNVKIIEGKTIFECPICGYVSTNNHRHNMRQHVHTHSDERPYQCELCGNQFKMLAHLKRHRVETHTDLKPYSCIICGKCFRAKKTLKIHTQRHMGYKPHICDICGMSFVIAPELRKHQVRHTEATPFKCGVCGLAYKNPASLSIHRRKHKPGRKDIYGCPRCGKSFDRKSSCKTHIERVHHEECRLVVLLT